MTTTVLHSPEETEAKLQKLLLEVDDLPSIPETLMEILKVLDDPDSGPADLSQVVRLDAPLMARILRLANSPYYSSRGDITDIQRCVAVLGYRTVRQVAICVSVATSVMSAVATAKGGLDYRELWRHSVVTAAVSKFLAKLAGYPEPEELFTAGLLHDMGKFVLEIHAPDKYWRLIARRAETGRTLTEVETEEFGFDHGVLGEAFGRSWRFPAVLTRSCAEHHQQLDGNPVQGREDLAVAVVSLADYLANTVEPCRSDLGFDPVVCDASVLHQHAGLTVEQVERSLPEMHDQIARASAFMDLG